MLELEKFFNYISEIEGFHLEFSIYREILIQTWQFLLDKIEESLLQELLVILLFFYFIKDCCDSFLVFFCKMWLFRRILNFG